MRPPIHPLACLAVAAALLGCSRGKPSGRPAPAVLAQTRAACDADTLPDSCLAWGRQLMAGEAPSLAEGEMERTHLARLCGRFASEELLGIRGAHAVRLGGMYARNEDVVTAVERVEEGLEIFIRGMADHPGSKVLRIYYAITLSHLPGNFEKTGETRDTIQSLKTRFPLSPGEVKSLDSALARLPD